MEHWRTDIVNFLRLASSFARQLSCLWAIDILNGDKMEKYVGGIHKKVHLYLSCFTRFCQVLKGAVGATLCQNEAELKFYIEIYCGKFCL